MGLGTAAALKERNCIGYFLDVFHVVGTSADYQTEVAGSVAEAADYSD
jgi:hypothetical protein